MDSVSEVKSRLNIEDVVSEYVQLKRAGRNFKGLSPFTNEKTPSFIVSPEKQIWHDFSSGKGGDVISFIQEVEGLDFKGSLELLSRKAGVDLSAFQGSQTGNSDQKNRLFKAVEQAVGYYQNQLLKNTAPLKYLREKRAFEKQTIIDFKFGYSPKTSDNLLKFLKNKGFSENEMLSAGLIVKRQSGLADMFRDRLMIPLMDDSGRPVGFTARQLKDEPNSPKYINTPSTILYDKGRQLFGLSMAKEAVRKTGYVVVVEGNLDVVASHQAGIKQVVASAGTALTTFHLKTLQRFTGDVRLAFDDDRAGQEAALRTIPLAQDLGIDLSLVAIPAGKDPDELIKKDVKLWQETVSKPVYMVDWLIDKLAESNDLKTAQGKRQFTTEVLSILRQIKDQVEQEHYIRIVADKTNTSIESINKKFTQSLHSLQNKRLKTVKTNPQNDNEESREMLVLEQHFLSILCAVPANRPLMEVMPADLFSLKAQDFLTSTKNFSEMDNSLEYGKMLLLLFEETYQHTESNELDYQLRALLARLIDFYDKYKKTEIIKQLESSNGDEELDLLKQVTELQTLKTKALKFFDDLKRED